MGYGVGYILVQAV